MAALIQIAAKQGHAEKEAMRRLEAKEIQEEAESNIALKISQGDHQSREAPSCKREFCEVHVDFRNTARHQNWN